VERIIPLLSGTQKKSHFEFSKHFRNNWGLGKGKYLLIHYDEKWFWGLVTRKGDRACEELGIDPHTFEAYHKSHINKTMGVAFVAFAFEDSIENGGKAVKLDFPLWCQPYKVAEKLVGEGVRGENGRITYSGPIKQRKGELYGEDCCVTGSKAGTADGFERSFRIQRFYFRIHPSTPYCSTGYQGRVRQQIPLRLWHTACWCDNKFLGVGGTPHVGVWKDFHQTNDGLVQKDSQIFAAP
jgi:hypothetical protein